MVASRVEINEIAMPLRAPVLFKTEYFLFRDLEYTNNKNKYNAMTNPLTSTKTTHLLLKTLKI